MLSLAHIILRLHIRVKFNSSNYKRPTKLKVYAYRVALTAGRLNLSPGGKYNSEINIVDFATYIFRLRQACRL